MLQELLAKLAGFNEDDLDAASDIIAEIRSEAAAFGDSAPGTAAQLQSCQAFLNDYKETLIALAEFPVFGPILPLAEEPF